MSGKDNNAVGVVADYVNIIKRYASAATSMVGQLNAALEEIDSPLDVNATLERHDQLALQSQFKDLAKLPPVVLNQIFSTLSCDNIVKLTRVNKELRNYIAANIRSIYANMRRKDKYLPVIEWDKIDASNRDVKTKTAAGMSLNDAITAVKMHTFRGVCSIPNYFLHLGEDKLKDVYPTVPNGIILDGIYNSRFSKTNARRSEFNKYLFLLNHGIDPKIAWTTTEWKTTTPIEAIRMMSAANQILSNLDPDSPDYWEIWDNYWEIWDNIHLSKNRKFYEENVVPRGPTAARAYIDSILDNNSVSRAWEAAKRAAIYIRAGWDKIGNSGTVADYKFHHAGYEKWPKDTLALQPNKVFDPVPTGPVPNPSQAAIPAPV